MADSGWNGRFTQEDDNTSCDRVVQQSSSSSVKTSSSSCVYEIVDGQERIVDQKHHETAKAHSDVNNQSLSMKSGTNITPEIHYKENVKTSDTKYDSADPELSQPQTKISESGREVHQVGDSHTTSAYSLDDKSGEALKVTDSVGNTEFEKNKRSQTSTSRGDFFGRDVIVDTSGKVDARAELERNKRGQLATRRDDFYGRDVMIGTSGTKNVGNIDVSAVGKAESERNRRAQLTTNRDNFF